MASGEYLSGLWLLADEVNEVECRLDAGELDRDSPEVTALLAVCHNFDLAYGDGSRRTFTRHE